MIIKFSRPYQLNAMECLIDKCVAFMSDNKFLFNSPTCSSHDRLQENSNIYIAFKFTLFTGDFRTDGALSLRVLT